MAIHIHTSKNLNATYSDIGIHLLPCKIHTDSDAKVKEYFEPSIKKDETNGVLQSSFRGYPLTGTKLKVPDGFEGMILHESVKPVSNEERKFYLTHKFNCLTYWNWDKVPSKNDMIYQALDWIDIADALHAPIIDAPETETTETKG